MKYWYNQGFRLQSLFSYTWHWTTQELRCQPSAQWKIHVQLIVCPPYLRFLHICASASPDSTNHRLCSTVVVTIEKKTTYIWTHTVQTPVVQGPMVISFGPQQLLNTTRSIKYSTEEEKAIWLTQRAFSSMTLGRFLFY